MKTYILNWTIDLLWMNVGCHDCAPTIFETLPDNRRRWGIRSPFIRASPISDKVGHGRQGPGRDTTIGPVVSGRGGIVRADDDDDNHDDLRFSLYGIPIGTAETPVSSSEQTRRLSPAAGYAFPMTNRCWRRDRRLDSSRVIRKATSLSGANASLHACLTGESRGVSYACTRMRKVYACRLG